jgi:FSR family fosmidomycin resistance protein-like MFS transporter
MKKRFVWLLSAGHFATDINQGALPAMLPFLIWEYNLSYTAAAGLVFAANFVSSIIQPLFGHFADKSSKLWLMPVGILLAGCGLAVVGVLSDYWLIFTAVMISGIGIAAFHPEGARMANKVSGEKKGTGVSIFAVGGNAGFAIGPVITTAALLFWGLKGTLILIVPAIIMAAIIASQSRKLQEFQKTTKKTEADDTQTAPKDEDEWIPFSRLTAVVFCRSIIFFSMNTFLPLYWLNILHQSKAASGSALTILFTVGAVSTLFGGQLADRLGYNKIIQIGFSALVPLLMIFTVVNNVTLATLLLIPIGMALFAPHSPMTVLGQKYLPNRIGFASGVTLGLAVSVGGIVAPILGWFADNYGLLLAMQLVAGLSIVPAVMAYTLSIPRSDANKVSKKSD